MKAISFGILIFVIIGIVLVSGCASHQSAGNISNETPTACKQSLNAPQECSGKSNSVSIITCAYQKLNISKRDINMSDQSVCNLYENISQEKCIAAIGAYLENASICNAAGDASEDCYISIAENDPKFTLADCDKMGVYYGDCYIAIAVVTDNASICSNVPVQSTDNCLEQVAVSTKNLRICTQMGSSSVKLRCASEILERVSSNDLTEFMCDDLLALGEGSLALTPDQCFYDVGIRTLDLQACARISNDDQRADCRARVQHASQS